MKDKKKKVLLLASVASMIDQFNMPNICLMQKLGYEVHVACNFYQGNTCSAARIQKLKDTLEKMHVQWHQWDCPREAGRLLACAAAYRQIYRLLEKHEFAWLHCQSPIGGALARIAAHRRGIPVMYTAHGFHFYKGAPLKNWLLYYPVEKLLAYWTDILVTINWEDYRVAKKLLRPGIVYHQFGIGVDIQKFSCTFCDREKQRRVFCKKYRIPEQAKLLLSVGELSQRKNHQIVLKALADLKNYEVYYLICGQGEKQKQLLCQARKLGVANRIRLAGFQEEVAQFYHAADIFVFPSIQEGMPVALMEAMAAGVPCVVSDIRGNRELMGTDANSSVCMPKEHNKHLRSVCFPWNDSKCLSSILMDLLEDEMFCHTLSAANQKKIQAYDKQAVSKKMEQIYRKMAQTEERGASCRKERR